MASRIRRGSGRDGVDADVVDNDVAYANEGIAEPVKFKLEGFDDAEDEVGSKRRAVIK
jgi:hypothetical protein